MSAVLIVEDDAQLAGTFQRFLKGAGYHVDVAVDYASAERLMQGGSYGAVFVDINLGGKKTGIDLLKAIRKLNLETPIVIMTGAPEVASAAEAVRNTAFDYLCKPIEKDELLKTAQAAVNHKIAIDAKNKRYQTLERAFHHVKDVIAAVDPNSVLVDQMSESAFPQGHHDTVLSDRENLVLSLLGNGESNADIALQLSISVRTVESYYTRIISKLSLSGMKALRRYAIQNRP